MQNIGVPILLLWLFSALVLAGSLVGLAHRDGVRVAWGRGCRSPLMPAVVWAGWGVFALTTSGNKGNGFITPLVPAFAVLTAWAVWRVPRPLARALAGMTVAALVLNTVVAFDPRPGWAQTRLVGLPWLGDQPLYSGGGVIQSYIHNGNPDLATGQLSESKGAAWHRAQLRLTAELNELGPAFAVFGFRHRLININTIGLEQLLAGREPLPLTMVDPVTVPNDQQAMARLPHHRRCGHRLRRARRPRSALRARARRRCEPDGAGGTRRRLPAQRHHRAAGPTHGRGVATSGHVSGHGRRRRRRVNSGRVRVRPPHG